MFLKIPILHFIQWNCFVVDLLFILIEFKIEFYIKCLDEWADCVTWLTADCFIYFYPNMFQPKLFISIFYISINYYLKPTDNIQFQLNLNVM